MNFIRNYGNILGVGVIMMIGLSFFSVLLHSLFNIIIISIQELIVYLHSAVFMLGIVYTYHYDKHVRIDVFYQKKKQSTKNKINIIGTMILLIPFFVFFFFTAYGYVLSSWSKLEISAEPGGLPFVYGQKTLLLIMPASMLMYSLYKLIGKK